MRRLRPGDGKVTQNMVELGFKLNFWLLLCWTSLCFVKSMQSLSGEMQADVDPRWPVTLLPRTLLFMCFGALGECLFSFYRHGWILPKKSKSRFEVSRYSPFYSFPFLLVGQRISIHFWLWVSHFRILTIADCFEMEIKPYPGRRIFHNRKM